MSQFCGKSSFIHSFRLFLKRLFKSSTTQRRSRHSMDTVSEFHVEAPQATVSEGLSQGPYVAARAGYEPMTLRTKGAESTNEPPCPHTPIYPSIYLSIHPPAYPSIHQSIASNHPRTRPTIHPPSSLHLSIDPSIHQTINPSIPPHPSNLPPLIHTSILPLFIHTSIHNISGSVFLLLFTFSLFHRPLSRLYLHRSCVGPTRATIPPKI